jgi:FKBP-type peptidyl-prolyl cis-trans isomerase (trigger factor)
MQINEISADGLKRAFKVTVAAKDIEQRLNTRLAEVARDIRLPGFRPGKVPTSVIKQRYGASLMGEVLEQTVNESSSSLMTERNLRPAMQPKVEIESFAEGADLVFAMNLEVLPEIDAQAPEGAAEETPAESDEETKAEYRKIAERRVRLGLVLADFGRIHDVQVSQEELNRAVMAEARRYPGQEKLVFDYYRKNPDAMGGLRAPIYEEKVVDLLVEKAKVTDKAVSPEDLVKLAGEEGEDETVA